VKYRRPPAVDAAEPHLLVLLTLGVREYRSAVRARLLRSGFDDLPRSGSWVLVTIGAAPATVGELAARLGTTKQGLSRLSDVMVERGYLRRSSDPSDHRLVSLGLTARGRAAAKSIFAAVKEVDRSVDQRVGPGGRARAERELRAAFGTGVQL